MIDEKLATKKCIRVYEEDDATMESFKIIDYVKGGAIDDSSQVSIDVDQPTSTST